MLINHFQLLSVQEKLELKINITLYFSPQMYGQNYLNTVYKQE